MGRLATLRRAIDLPQRHPASRPPTQVAGRREPGPKTPRSFGSGWQVQRTTRPARVGRVRPPCRVRSPPLTCRICRPPSHTRGAAWDVRGLRPHVRRSSPRVDGHAPVPPAAAASGAPRVELEVVRSPRPAGHAPKVPWVIRTWLGPPPGRMPPGARPTGPRKMR